MKFSLACGKDEEVDGSKIDDRSKELPRLRLRLPPYVYEAVAALDAIQQSPQGLVPPS